MYKKNSRKVFAADLKKQIFKIFTSTPTTVAPQEDTKLNKLLARPKNPEYGKDHITFFSTFRSSCSQVFPRCIVMKTSWEPPPPPKKKEPCLSFPVNSEIFFEIYFLQNWLTSYFFAVPGKFLSRKNMFSYKMLQSCAEAYKKQVSIYSF